MESESIKDYKTTGGKMKTKIITINQILKNKKLSLSVKDYINENKDKNKKVKKTTRKKGVKRTEN